MAKKKRKSSKRKLSARDGVKARICKDNRKGNCYNLCRSKSSGKFVSKASCKMKLKKKKK